MYYESNTQIIGESLANLGKIYATSFIIYFCISCCVISNHFKTINDRVKQLSKTCSDVKYLTEQLRYSQTNYVLLCSSVELLNESFGFILLLEILFIFVGFTNNCLKLLFWFDENELYVNILILFIVGNMLSILVMVCFCAENIRNQVKKIENP